MDKSLRGLANYIVFFLSQGMTEGDIETQFVDRYGSVPQDLWDAAFSAASIGEANAENLPLCAGNKLLRNCLDLGGRRSGDVEIRFLVLLNRTGRAEDTANMIYRSYSTSVDVEMTVQQVYDFIDELAADNSESYGLQIVRTEIIPGIYLPAL